jgi:hypothetical protein
LERYEYQLNPRGLNKYNIAHKIIGETKTLKPFPIYQVEKQLNRNKPYMVQPYINPNDLGLNHPMCGEEKQT